jgi:hypothetical protein
MSDFNPAFAAQVYSKLVSLTQYAVPHRLKFHQLIAKKFKDAQLLNKRAEGDFSQGNVTQWQ